MLDDFKFAKKIKCATLILITNLSPSCDDCVDKYIRQLHEKIKTIKSQKEIDFSNPYFRGLNRNLSCLKERISEKELQNILHMHVEKNFILNSLSRYKNIIEPDTCLEESLARLISVYK